MTQNEKVLALLRERPITALDAMRDLGCMRLAARIADLRAQGHDIDSDRIKVRDRWGDHARVARYTLVSERPDPLGDVPRRPVGWTSHLMDIR